MVNIDLGLNMQAGEWNEVFKVGLEYMSAFVCNEKENCRTQHNKLIWAFP